MCAPSPLAPLALIGNLDFSEVVLIGIAAILIFGRRLPEVAGQVARGVGQARRALEELWRESGLEREIDEVRRQVDDARRGLPRLDSGKRMARSLIERASEPREVEPEARAAREPEPAALPQRQEHQPDAPGVASDPLPPEGSVARLPPANAGRERPAPAEPASPPEPRPAEPRPAEPRPHPDAP